MRLNFEGAIAPVTVTDFLSKTWGTNFIHIQGQENRFNYLLSWNELNRILSNNRLEPPRLRLSKDGLPIPAEDYLSYSQTRRGQRIPTIIPEKLNEKLYEGSTLVLDAIDELHDPISELVYDFEVVLDDSIQVNAYIGFGKSSGFNLHWDDHDVFILQVSGRKKWSIYGETRKFPLYWDDHDENLTPENPIWEGIINDGDLLYIPRGVWHDAHPIGEPTIHLTFGITNRNGIHLLNWIVDQTIKDEFFRMDIPLLHDKHELELYFNKFNVKLKERIDKFSIQEFIQHTVDTSSLKSKLSLPHGITDIVRPSVSSFIRLASSKRINIYQNKNTEIISFKINNVEWEFATSTRKFFEFLFEKRKCSITEAKALVPSVEQGTFDLFINELLKTGLVFISNS